MFCAPLLYFGRFPFPVNKLSSQLLMAKLLSSNLSVLFWLLTKWKFDLSNKIKQEFFEAVAVSVLLYGRTTWTLTKCLEEKLDRNYTNILHAVLKKSWKQYTTKQQLYGHLFPVSYTTQERWARHDRHLPSKIVDSDGWWDSQKNLCCRHALMMNG